MPPHDQQTGHDKDTPSKKQVSRSTSSGLDKPEVVSQIYFH